MIDEPEGLEAYRDLFPVTAEYAYLNNASFSPLPMPVVEAVNGHLQEMMTTPIDLVLERLVALGEEVKQQAATLLNAARPDEIVQVPGTATGINIALEALPLEAGDNILALEGDYPAVIYPCLNLAPRGILTKMVPQVSCGLDLDVLAKRIDSRTRAVVISTAMFATGFRNDIEGLGRLCRERDLFLVVDAIQTLGCLPLDVQAANIDFLACGSHKWLLAPPGTGILYCRHDLIDRLQLGPYVGALSVVEPENFLDYNFTLRPDASRFAVSAWPFSMYVALHAALGLLLEIGIDRIAQRVLALTATAIQDLELRGLTVVSPTDDRHRSGIVIVEVADPPAACKRLLEAGIITAPRGRGIRISPNFFNIEEEVCRVGEVLAP